MGLGQVAAPPLACKMTRQKKNGGRGWLETGGSQQQLNPAVWERVLAHHIGRLAKRRCLAPPGTLQRSQHSGRRHVEEARRSPGLWDRIAIAKRLRWCVKCSHCIGYRIPDGGGGGARAQLLFWLAPSDRVSRRGMVHQDCMTAAAKNKVTSALFSLPSPCAGQ